MKLLVEGADEPGASTAEQPAQIVEQRHGHQADNRHKARFLSHLQETFRQRPTL
jgi:hypothetical protein